VSMYLPEATLQSTLRFIASHGHGSSLVFDFATRAMVEGIQRIDLASIPAAARASMERFLDMIRDEPWLFGIPLDEEKSFLASLGLELGELVTIGDEASAARYLTRSDGTVVGGTAMIRAQAMRKAAIDQMVGQADPSQRAMIEERMKTQARQMAYRIAEAFLSKPSATSASGVADGNVAALVACRSRRCRVGGDAFECSQQGRQHGNQQESHRLLRGSPITLLRRAAALKWRACAPGVSRQPWDWHVNRRAFAPRRDRSQTPRGPWA
jgi:hypothetical protein